MGECPECGRKIDELFFEYRQTTFGICYYTEFAKRLYFEDDYAEEGLECKCPECNQVIAESRNKAEEILKGGDKDA